MAILAGTEYSMPYKIRAFSPTGLSDLFSKLFPKQCSVVFQILVPFRLLQNIEQSSLYYQ